MNIATKPAHASLAQRIAKVRNCMLVEISTGISATDKDLFVSLCQAYEQNNVETSYTATASTSSQNALEQAFSLSLLTPEGILSHELAALPGKDTPPRQRKVGFSIIRWPNLADFDDFSDWDNAW